MSNEKKLTPKAPPKSSPKGESASKPAPPRPASDKLRSVLGGGGPQGKKR